MHLSPISQLSFQGGKLTLLSSGVITYKRTEKATKTDDPRRVVVVQPLAEVLEALEAQRQWLIETRHPGFSSGLVFRRTFENLSRRAGGRSIGSPIPDWLADRIGAGHLCEC